MKPGDCKVSHLLTGVSCIVGAIFSITVYNHYQMVSETQTECNCNSSSFSLTLSLSLSNSNTNSN